MRTLLLAVLACLAVTPCRAELPLAAAIEGLRTQARAQVAAGRLDELLADLDQSLRTQARLADGRWKLALQLGSARRAFEAVAQGPADWDRNEAALKALAARHPESPNAWILQAQFEEAHAWAERGRGYADSVSPAAFAAFRRHLRAGLDVLQAHQTLDNPAWYESRIALGGPLGDSPEELDAILQAAIRRQPDYQQTWFSRLTWLTPQWGGSLDDMARLINQAARTTAGTERSGMMARLLWIASEQGQHEVIDLPAIDWAVVKRSFGDVLTRYPNEWNAQWFFYEACRHADRPAATFLRKFVKSPPSAALLREHLASYTMCVDWESGKIPRFTLRDPDTGKSRLIE